MIFPGGTRFSCSLTRCPRHAAEPGGPMLVLHTAPRTGTGAGDVLAQDLAPGRDITLPCPREVTRLVPHRQPAGHGGTALAAASCYEPGAQGRQRAGCGGGSCPWPCLPRTQPSPVDPKPGGGQPPGQPDWQAPRDPTRQREAWSPATRPVGRLSSPGVDSPTRPSCPGLRPVAPATSDATFLHWWGTCSP